MASGTATSSTAFPENHDPILEQITSELIEQLRQSGRIDRCALALRYPDHADQLDSLCATAELVAGLGHPLPGPPNEAGGYVLGRLGDFEILRERGRGGMGVVYEARQLSLNRLVALKILPFAAVLDERNLKRFKNEALAAAQLNHPHIVDVYGVGCERGVHYYAMRLIEGQSLAQAIALLRQKESHDPSLQQSKSSVDRLSDSNGTIAHSPSRCETAALAGLSTVGETTDQFDRRAALLCCDAADALHHAHEQGVIHRDIKPSNLLIDGRLKIWIADFGLAHIEAAGDLTLSGELMGTLRYMSPEQAAGQRLGVDHRTDVYSLGVTLYELLTLRCPFEAASRSELLQAIMTQEPVSPRQRRASIASDLETIVLKAIAKSPADRYLTAQEMASDLRRFADGQPIYARRANEWERAWRWIKRNRGMVALGATVAMLLLAMTVGAIAIAIEMNRARRTEHELRVNAQRAERESQVSSRNAQAAEGLARANELKALNEAEVSRTTTRFLENLFRTADPSGFDGSGFSSGRVHSPAELTARDIVKLGIERLKNELSDQPLVRAQLLTSVGTTAFNLGMIRDAEELLDEALEIRSRLLGTEHLETAETLCAIGRVYIAFQRNEADWMFDRVMRIQQRELPADDLRLAASRTYRAQLWIENGSTEAIVGDWLRTALRTRLERLGPRHAETQVTLMLYAIWEHSRSRDENLAAEKIRSALNNYDPVLGSGLVKALLTHQSAIREIRAFKLVSAGEKLKSAEDEMRAIFGGADHPFLVMVLDDWYWWCKFTDQIAVGADKLQEAFQMQTRLVGTAPRTQELAIALAEWKMNSGDLRAAEALLKEVMEQEIDYPGYWNYGRNARRLYGKMLVQRGEYDLAIKMHQSSLTLGGGPKTGANIRDDQIAEVEMLRGRTEELQTLAEEAPKQVYPPYATTAKVCSLLGWLRSCEMTGDEVTAAELRKQLPIAIGELPRRPEQVHPDDLPALSHIAAHLPQCSDGEALLNDWLKSPQAQAFPNLPFTATIRSALATIHVRRGDFETAEKLVREALSSREACFGSSHPETLGSIIQLARIRAARHDPVEAEELARDSLKRRLEIAGSNDAWTWWLARQTALVLREAGQLKEAETLARDTRETVGKRLGRLHPDYVVCSGEVALVLLEQDRPAEAESLLRATLSELEANLPEKNAGRVWLNGLLGACLASKGSSNREFARQMLQSSHDSLVAIAGEADDRARLIWVYLQSIP